MKHYVKFRRTGMNNSLVITIPKEIVDKDKLLPKQTISVEDVEDGLIIKYID